MSRDCGAAHKITSPCPSCHRWGDEMDECAPLCQARVDYLHTAFGEPLIDTEKLRREHEAMHIPSRQLDFIGPGPKARKFNCPICGVEVETSHWAQKTCNEGECPGKYAKLADAARKARNRERNSARAKQRRRERRMAGTVI